MNDTNKNLLLVVPCFNEGKRLNKQYFDSILGITGVNLLFVNDGSTDNTLDYLQRAFTVDTQILDLQHNVGKAEAVRRGMIMGLNSKEYSNIGFIDADGAFSVEDIYRLISITREGNGASIIWSSRVKLAGSHIERNWFRHYIGRILVTLLTFGIPNCPYDSQSGFKIFLNNEVTSKLFAERFETKWLFDIEIILRLWKLRIIDSIVEVPLSTWYDVSGSKLSNRSFLVIVKESLNVILLRRRLSKDL
jgi:dolichyl-phosphate beta-glucosyltransferase